MITRPDSFAFERKDCTVRAFSTAANIPYQDAHAAMELGGRKPKRGVYTPAALAKLKPLVESTPVIRKRITLQAFCKRFPEGRYLMRRKGHAFAVVDGKAYDGPSPKSFVLNAWKVKLK